VHWITRMIIARKLATWQKIHKTLSPRHFRMNWLFSDNYKLSYLCYVSLGNPLQILDRTANLGFEVNGQHSSRWCPFRTLSSLKSKPIPGRRENRIFLLIRCCFSDNAMNEDSPIGFQVHYHKQFFVILISITSHKDIKYDSNQPWGMAYLRDKLWSALLHFSRIFFLMMILLCWGQIKARYRTNSVKIQFQWDKIWSGINLRSEGLTGLLPRKLSWENEVNTWSLEQLYTAHPGKTLSCR